jgi:hypothetical protein
MPSTERQQVLHRQVKTLAEAHDVIEEVLRSSHDGRHVTHFGHIDELVIQPNQQGTYDMLLLWHPVYVISTLH